MDDAPTMADAPTLRTDRLVLRGWSDEDRDAFAAMCADPEVMRHFPAPLTRLESDQLIDRFQAHFAEYGFGLWAVELAGVGFVGFVGLNTPSFEAPFTPCVEAGWRLVRRAWGRGVATEAARCALQFGFHEAGLEQIRSWTTPANARSIAVMERVGMRRDAAHDFGHPRVPAGHPQHRHVMYVMDRPDWQRLMKSAR